MKDATGRKREGKYDLSLSNVDREAQYAFNDLSKMWKERLGSCTDSTSSKTKEWWDKR